MQDYNVEDTIAKILDSNKSWMIQEKMPLILEEIESLKTDMAMFLQTCNVDIEGIFHEAKMLSKESIELNDEMKACKMEIEQKTLIEIMRSIENHDKVAKELEIINFSINICHDICQCGNYIKFFEEGKEAQVYSKAVESIYGLLQFTDNPVDGFNQLDLYINIKNNGQIILDSLWHDLYEQWDQMVSYTIKPGTRKTIVTINITLEDSLTCVDILNALDLSKKLPEKISEFLSFLKKEVFIPLLRNECIIYFETKDISNIHINHNKTNSKPNYVDVMDNMKRLFQFLNNKFNIEYANSKTVMKMFGSLICVEFCDLLVNECFALTVPNNINDLQSYGRITSEIEEFQSFLITIKVLPEEGLSLLKYMANIDVLFANCSSQHFLESARSIMLKDLSITMSIGIEKIPEDASDLQNVFSECTSKEALEIFEKAIPKSLFYFPRCLISKTAQELLDLVYIIMEQAVQCSDVVCKKLYNTVRFIFELYDAVVPYHHENYLQTIPQYVALFHNNCMYLAHNLQTLGDKWLSLMEGRKLNYAIGFVDLVHKIRDLGHKHLTIHMQQQRKQILDNIRSSDLNCIVVKDVLGDNAEAAVRQCLRQLQLLKNVWIGVFPSNVFTKLIATLVNMFVDELIHRVCTVEDISMEMATQLTDIYTVVVQKSPQLFQTPTDVEKYVKSWTKLQELIFVLGGSLKDIENHWNDGTGPLAIHFEVDELRSLIKALFQNTQFRANLLSKIK